MQDHYPKEPDRAAQAFYGQPADLFARQVAKICANDQRLIAIFKKTRDAYLQRKFTEDC